MWHLALETIGLAGSVALFQGGELVRTASLATESGSAKNLMPAIEALLREQRVEARELQLVSLAHGPGSFTGLRVGVSTAKAFGFALRVPLVAVDTLEVLIHCLAHRSRDLGEEKICLCAAMDAYRKQVFRCVAGVQYIKGRSSAAGSSAAGSSAAETSIWILDASHCYDAKLWQSAPSAALTEVRPAPLASGSKPSLDNARDVEAVIKAALHPSEVEADETISSGAFTGGDSLDDEVRRQWPLVVGGNALGKYPLAENLSGRVIYSSKADIDAADVGRLAWIRFQSGVVTDPLRLLPNYLRGSAAEEKQISVIGNETVGTENG